jgi:pimeloyl-ACP methyl ester carboxylesterase
VSQLARITSLMVTRTWQRSRNRRALAAATGPGGIDEAGYVTAGGIEHFRTLRGADRDNPVLVFVHGGPGATQTIFNTATIPWERHVTVVHYDQRGSGKTLERSGPAPGLTLARLETDAVAMIEQVRRELSAERVILAGSSAGSAVALAVAARRPDLVSAYIGTDQLASPRSRGISYRLTLDGLRRTGNAKGVAALDRIGDGPHTREQYDRIVRWTMAADPAIPHMVDDVIIPAMLTSPLHTTRDAKVLDEGMKASMAALFDELGTFDAHVVAPRLEMPVVLVHGADDIVNPTVCVQRWYASLEASSKELVLFEGTGHLAAFTRPDRFAEVLRRVRDRLVRT